MVAKMPVKDGLSRRVDALLDLLVAASMDTMDNQFLELEYSRCTLEMKKPTHPELPDSPQAWDKHIDKMIRQLREAVRDTPEKQQPEEPEPEPLERQSSYGRRGIGVAPPARDSYEYEPEELPEIPQEDRRRKRPERERSSASYPKIGPGYSDSISVCSDLTIPTVVDDMDVPEEEDYSRPSPGIGMALEFSSKPSRSSKGDRQRRAPPPVEQPKPKSRNKTASYSNAQSANRLTATDLRAPSQRVTAPLPPPRPPLDVAQRRRESHQATMAQLGERPSVLPAAGNPRASVPAIKPGKSMPANYFPSLNELPNSSSPDKGYDVADGRRSLLDKPDKFSRDTPTASSRILLSNQTTKSKKATKYGGVISRRLSSTEAVGEITGELAAEAAKSTENNVGLDGVFSTIGQNIDFLFSKSTTLKENQTVPVKMQPGTGFSETNNGATAKIKYTSGSVDEQHLGSKDGIGFGGGWPSIDSQKADKHAGLLVIDEDGFIVATDPNENPFGDPFAMQPREKPETDFGFETSFFNSSRDTKPVSVPRNTTKASHGISEAGTIPTKKKGGDKVSNSLSKGADKQSRIDAVEMATKKKIDKLRQLVAARAGEGDSGGSKNALDNKLDFVEEETMKQISWLRDQILDQASTIWNTDRVVD
jgi:hypothetical protein